MAAAAEFFIDIPDLSSSMYNMTQKNAAIKFMKNCTGYLPGNFVKGASRNGSP